MTPRTATELKEFILSAPERHYPITYLDGLTEDHLKLIVHNIEKERELNAIEEAFRLINK